MMGSVDWFCIGLLLITCTFMCCASFIGGCFFLYKAYVYYKAGGISREEMHYHSYDHSINTLNENDDDSESWKFGDH